MPSFQEMLDAKMTSSSKRKSFDEMLKEKELERDEGQTFFIRGKEVPIKELGPSPFHPGTKEDMQRYYTDIISGLGGLPHALTQLPKSVVSQIQTLFTGEDGEISYETMDPTMRQIFQGLDTASEYLPQTEDIRKSMTDEEATALDRYIMAASQGAPFGPAGMATMTGFQGLEEGLEATEASPRVKAAARLGGMAAAGLKTKKGLQPKNAAEAQMMKFFKKYNIPDEQASIALSKPGSAKKWISKIASKKGKAEAILEATGEGLGSVYETLKESPAADAVLGTAERNLMESKLNVINDSFPVEIRKSIKGDLEEFYNSPRSAGDMINLWQDINQAFKGKKKQLQRLKEPIMEGLENIDPEFAKDFKNVNDAYSNYQEVRNIMKPGDWGFFSHLKGPAAVIGYILKGTPMGALKIGVPAYILTKLAREMIINPKLKNISKKLSYGISKRSLGVTQMTINELADEVKNIDEELAETIRSVDAKEILPSDKKTRTNQ
jgi:hypothetical protein